LNRLQRFAGECRYDANMNMVRKTAGTTVTNHIHDIENRMIGLDMAADVPNLSLQTARGPCRSRPPVVASVRTQLKLGLQI